VSGSEAEPRYSLPAMTDRVKPLGQSTIAAGLAFKLIEIAEAAGFASERLSEIDLPPRSAHAIETRLEAELVKEIPLGLPTLDAAASRMGMSSRTLRRRLREEGTRFQDVLDRARCALAKHYLDEPKLALGEVAFLLGFSEPSAFHRAFKRWTGATPLSHRRGALAPT